MRSELPVKSNGLHIWTESFGNHLHAPILLIAGAGGHAVTFVRRALCVDGEGTRNTLCHAIVLLSDGA